MPLHDRPGHRPTLGVRHSSTSSIPRRNNLSPLSPTTPAPSTSHKSTQLRPHRQHVVGHSRGGHSRNPSLGKNLNKLTKLTQVHSGDGLTAGRHHRRSHSATSPRLGPLKRIGSDGSLYKDPSAASLKPSSSTTSLKKDNSHAILKRVGSTGEALRSAKSEGKLSRPTSSHSKKSLGNRRTSVHFDVGSEGQDDAWTEDSNPQSPALTRKSSILSSNGKHQLGANRFVSTPPQSPRKADAHPALPETLNKQQNEGYSDHYPARSLDADAITSRLLHRHPTHNAPPQMSTISATATSANHSPRSISHSQGSTLNNTPGMASEVVSRFINTSANGTPKDGALLTLDAGNTTSQLNGINSALDAHKRAKSASNLTSPKSVTSLPSRSRQLPPSSKDNTNNGNNNVNNSNAPYSPLHPSRTQQKLWLQRASSNVEPQQLPPNGAGGIGHVPAGGQYQEGRDPRLQRQFEQAALEYRVVRRYRDPVGDALTRLTQLPSAARNRRIPSARQLQGHQQSHGSQSYGGGGERSGLSQSLKETRAGRSAVSLSRVALDGSRGSKDDSSINGHGVNGDRARRDSDQDRDISPERRSGRHDHRHLHHGGDDDGNDDAAEELLRRIWDRVDSSAMIDSSDC
ncbi:MAG: hypothetical protein M1819_001808 [Sarea resinae]|nr:MAG: hypothetical protein M1819_001808 [Sarea resinae]